MKTILYMYLRFRWQYRLFPSHVYNIGVTSRIWPKKVQFGQTPGVLTSTNYFQPYIFVYMTTAMWEAQQKGLAARHKYCVGKAQLCWLLGYTRFCRFIEFVEWFKARLWWENKKQSDKPKHMTFINCFKSVCSCG